MFRNELRFLGAGGRERCTQPFWNPLRDPVQAG